MVYAGKALFLRYRNEEEVVAELAEMNVRISLREVSLLAMKFITYLAIAHEQHAPKIMADMQLRGGYICHLDATCEGGNPFLMSSIDSLSDIVLGNIKLPAENEAHITPFLERIKNAYGTPLALVHDMGSGILASVTKVFEDVPDFICHFHFLRDIGKDLFGDEYKTIRNRIAKHGIRAKLLYRAKRLKSEMDANKSMIKSFHDGINNCELAPDAFEFAPLVGAYTLIQWVLNGRTQGNGYGFPFDCPHLSFAKRLHLLNDKIEHVKNIKLRGQWQDNRPYFKIHIILKPLINDRILWQTIEKIEEKIVVFEKLRKAMRIASPSNKAGLNDEGQKGNVSTIEKRVKKFRAWLIRRKSYPQDTAARKMIAQIDKYWDKLFADPITVQTPSGSKLIQPQRTNNILEQFFRSLKRTHRRRTGNASSRRMLRTILAETPLVRNLKNPAYMKILLNGKTSIENVFSKIDIDTFRSVFKNARSFPENVPRKLNMLAEMSDFPEKLVEIVERAAA
jgi:hypothetical protein